MNRVQSFMLVLLIFVLLLACETPGPEVRIIDCKEQLDAAQLRYAKMLKRCRDDFKGCKEELLSCLDDTVDYD